MRLHAFLLLAIFGVAGCSGPPGQSGPLRLIYAYPGTGARPEFDRDLSLKIERIRAGPLASSHVGMTPARTPAKTDETYAPVEIQFADGSKMRFAKVRIQGQMGGQLTRVTVYGDPQPPPFTGK